MKIQEIVVERVTKNFDYHSVWGLIKIGGQEFYGQLKIKVMVTIAPDHKGEDTDGGKRYRRIIDLIRTNMISGALTMIQAAIEEAVREKMTSELDRDGKPKSILLESLQGDLSNYIKEKLTGQKLISPSGIKDTSKMGIIFSVIRVVDVEFVSKQIEDAIQEQAKEMMDALSTKTEMETIATNAEVAMKVAKEISDKYGIDIQVATKMVEFLVDIERVREGDAKKTIFNFSGLDNFAKIFEAFMGGKK